MSSTERYNSSPNICKFCRKVIKIKVGQEPWDVRKKVFCSHSCSAKFGNRSPRRPVSKTTRPCISCGKKIRGSEAVHCASCRAIFLHEIAGNLSKGQASRTRISAHARRIIKDRLSSCSVCGYDFAVEAAHIKPVKSFSEDTLVRDINQLENLLALCPNHHLEFDRGKLKLEDIPSRTRVAA